MRLDLWDGDDLLPAAVAEGDQQHLVDVELAAEALAAGAVEGDCVVAVGERPFELAQIRPFGLAAGLAEELDDRGTAVHLTGDRRRSGHAPHGVLGDHLDERPGVAAAEGREDAVDVVDGAQRSSGAIVRPRSTSCEW